MFSSLKCLSEETRPAAATATKADRGEASFWFASLVAAGPIAFQVKPASEGDVHQDDLSQR